MKSNVQSLLVRIGPNTLQAMLIAVAFLSFFDPSILNPQNIGWINEGDLRQHYLGWIAFRHAETLGTPWANAPLLAFPHGTPITATDSNPLVSLLLWPISDFLPADFQFIGIWYLTSIALSMIIARSLLRHAGFDAYLSVLLGAFLAFQPILFWRYGHDTLTAHWLILAAIHVSFVTQNIFRAIALHGLLLVTAIMIHPYLFIMLNFVLGFDILSRAIRRMGRRFGIIEVTALSCLAAQVSAIFVGYKLGIFSLANPYPNLIGVFSTDLMSFLNSFGSSSFIPQVKAGEGQYEGYAYLGLGFLVVVGFAISSKVRSQSQRMDIVKIAPLLAAASVAFLFALSPIVTVFGSVVFDMEIQSGSPIATIFEKLRSSGRFVWVTVYTLVFVVILTLPRKASIATIGIALLALVIQFLDLAPLRDRVKADTAFRETEEHLLSTAAWRERIERAEYIYMSRPLGLEFSMHAGAAAFPLNTPLSYFYTAQGLGLPLQQTAEKQLSVRVLSGNYDQSSLILLDPSIELPVMHRNASDIFSTQDFGEFHAVETSAFLGEQPISSETVGLADLLKSCTQACTAVLVTQGNAFEKLSAETRLHMRSVGSRVETLSNGDGFAAIIRDGLLLEEQLGMASDATLNIQVADRSISVKSSPAANVPSQISVEGVDYARNVEGMNLFMIWDSGKMLSAVFETGIQSDSLRQDSEFDLGVAPTPEPEENQGLVIDQTGDFLDLSGQYPVSEGQPFIGIKRYLTEESSLLDVISDCRQACIMAISVKDEGSASMPREVRRKAAQIGLTLSELEFRDGYSAIVENGIVLVQARSFQEAVDVAEVIDGLRIRVQSAGYEAGNKSSITIDGVEHSMAQRGINIVVVLEGERIITYHFDTHGGISFKGN